MTQSNLKIFWAYCKTMRQRQLSNVKVPNGMDFASHCKPTCMLEPGWSCLSLPPQPKILKDRLGCKVLKECFRQMVICQARGSVLQSSKTTECPFQRISSSNNIQLTCTLQERDFLFALRARDDVAEDRSLSTQSFCSFKTVVVGLGFRVCGVKAFACMSDNVRCRPAANNGHKEWEGQGRRVGCLGLFSKPNSWAFPLLNCEPHTLNLIKQGMKEWILIVVPKYCSRL